jgi:hypothetical protein
MRHLTTLAASAVTILTLAACGSSPAPTVPQPPGSPGLAPGRPLSADLVTGTVTWPNGDLAGNTQVYWFVGGYRLDSPVDYAISPVSADGRYSLGGCPCAPLTGYLFVPPRPGADPLHGGRDCWIILQARGTYQGVTANPGEVIDWQALDLPCSAHPYRSGPADVQAEARLLNPATSRSDSSATGGSWQDAEARTGGG